MKMLLVVVAMLVGFQSVTEGTTLIQLIYGNVMRDLINTAGLRDMLSRDGPFTVFLPSEQNLLHFLKAHNISLATVKQDPAELKNYLLFHIVNGTLSYHDFYNERIITALNGWQFRVNLYPDDGILTVQGVRVYGRSLASNGALFLLSRPMTPLSAGANIAAIVSLYSDLTIFINATLTAGLDTFLADQKPVTLFAPTNAAFNALGAKLDPLMNNPPLLAEVLKYHVVPGTIYSAGMSMAELPTFEADDRLHIRSVFRHKVIEGGHIIDSGIDIPATNGVIHKIDRVLIPASLRDQI